MKADRVELLGAKRLGSRPSHGQNRKESDYFLLADDPGVIAASARQEKSGPCFAKSAKRRPLRRLRWIRDVLPAVAAIAL